jgi:hypothetical protein
MSNGNSVFAKGISFFNPHDNAPDFVIGTAVIDLKKLIDWAAENPELLSDYKGSEQLRLQVKRSRDGKIYADVDTYGTKAGKSNGNGRASYDAPGDDLPY